MVALGEYAAEIVECCPICSGEGEFVFTAPVLYNEISLDVYSCPDCNCTYNNPRMTKEAMSEYYSSGEYYYHVTEIRKGRGSFGERRRALRLMLILMNLANIKEPTRCLDVGCGQGHFLQRLKDWSYGVETFGHDIYIDPGAVCEVIIDKNEIPGKFDLISCIHVLEHMHDPMEELEWMKSLLVDDGLLILELPIVRYIMIEHPITFSLDSIPIMMGHIGIENYTSIHIPTLESCLVFAKNSKKENL